MTSPAAVLWDMDGTIVDTEEHWMTAAAGILREHDVVVDPALMRRFVGMSMEAGAELMRALGVELPVAELVELHVDRAMAITASAPLAWRPGALEMLTALRDAGVPQALVTASYRASAEPILAALPAGVFAATVTGDEVARGKPHPDPYLRAAELLDVDPRACIAVEDSLIGLAAARAAGARTIGVPHHLEIPASDADEVWPTLVGRGPADLAGVVTA